MVAMPDSAQIVTIRGRELLEVIRSNGDWISRAQLAHATGKSRLSPHDAALLDRMVAAGLIEVRERFSNTPIGKAYEYKIKEG